jgi:uncharacterized protein with GYD domain
MTIAAFLLQLACTPEAWAAQIKNPQNRLQAVTPALEKLGGRFEAAYMAFGEYDLVAVMHLPDNVSAAAALAFNAGGALKAIKTTPLLTVEEGLEAMRRAGGLAGVYRPPAAS